MKDRDLRGAINLIRTQAVAATDSTYEQKAADTKTRFKPTKLTAQEGHIKKVTVEQSEDVLTIIRNAMNSVERSEMFSPSQNTTHGTKEGGS